MLRGGLKATATCGGGGLGWEGVWWVCGRVVDGLVGEWKGVGGRTGAN